MGTCLPSVMICKHRTSLFHSPVVVHRAPHVWHREVLSDSEVFFACVWDDRTGFFLYPPLEWQCRVPSAASADLFAAVAESSFSSLGHVKSWPLKTKNILFL